MTETNGREMASLQDVVRELRRQQRWNGILWWLLAAGIVLFARWLNGEAPYAGNGIYTAVMYAMLMLRMADMELVRAVARLATLLAERESLAVSAGGTTSREPSA